MQVVSEYDVEAINLGRRLALLNTGQTVRITNFYDEDGDDTNDPADTLAVTVALPDGKFWSGAVADFITSTTRH